jgi:hypothetical protein
MLRNHYFYYAIVMRGVQIIFLLGLLFWGLPGLTQPPLNEWLSISNASAEEKEKAYQRVQSLVKSIKEYPASEQRTLQRIFHRVHATFLKRYESYTDFHTLFADGTYDCLTATALFSYVLTELKYDFTIIETNYHIFILVETARGRVMLETTDRVGGFETDLERIANRTGEYRKSAPLATQPDQLSYQYTFSLYHAVSPEKLTGLLIYNQAVKAYNGGDWLACARALEKAYAAYATPRCKELSDILVRTVIETNASVPIRQECMSRLKPLLMAGATTVAFN